MSEKEKETKIKQAQELVCNVFSDEYGDGSDEAYTTDAEQKDK